MSLIKSSFPNISFGIYDDLTSDHVPGQLKYDVCMTEQVSGPQGTKIAGRHMVMIPNRPETDLRDKMKSWVLYTTCHPRDK